MPSLRDSAPSGAPRLLRGSLRSLVLAAAVASSTLLPGAVAAADEPAGTTVAGRLVQAWAEGHPDDTAAGSGDGQVAWVQTADGDAVHVDSAAVADVPTGATVELTLGSELEETGEDQPPLEVLQKEIVALPAAEPALADRAGLTNQVTVVLVQPAGVAPDGVTEAQVVDTVNGPVADFWSEQTNGAVKLGVTTSHGWTPTAAGCANAGLLWDEVAAAVGFVPGAGNHLLLYVSGAAAGCSYALAEVGGTTSSGGRLYVTKPDASVIAHEFGHNFGLGHSSGEQCEGAVEGASCRTAGYRDLYDVMGVSWGRLGSLNAAQAARLAVLPAAQVQSLTVQGAATTSTLAPLAGRTGTRALRLTDAEGTDYWLEYRAATGRDAWLGTAADGRRLDTGVLLRRSGTLPDTSVLLDGTPGPADGWDGDFQAALPLGVAVPVSGGDFSIVVRSVSAAGAVVAVTPTPPSTAPVPAAPAAPAPAGGVLTGSGAAPAMGAVPAEIRTSKLDGLLSTTPALESAAEGTSGGGVLVATAAALLAGSMLLVVRRIRRRSIAK